MYSVTRRYDQALNSTRSERRFENFWCRPFFDRFESHRQLMIIGSYFPLYLIDCHQPRCELATPLAGIRFAQWGDHTHCWSDTYKFITPMVLQCTRTEHCVKHDRCKRNDRPERLLSVEVFSSSDQSPRHANYKFDPWMGKADWVDRLDPPAALIESSSIVCHGDIGRAGQYHYTYQSCLLCDRISRR